MPVNPNYRLGRGSGGGASGTDGAQLRRFRRAITNDEIINLPFTSLELLPAPGEDQAYIVHGMTFLHVGGTKAWPARVNAQSRSPSITYDFSLATAQPDSIGEGWNTGTGQPHGPFQIFFRFTANQFFITANYEYHWPLLSGAQLSFGLPVAIGMLPTNSRATGAPITYDGTLTIELIYSMMPREVPDNDPVG